MVNEVVLFDVRKYKRSAGFVKVQCAIQEELTDKDLKEELVGILLDTPCPDRGVKLLQDVCGATWESACRVCREIATDLYNGSHEIRPPAEEDDGEKTSRPTVGDPGMGLLQIMQEQRRKSKHHRHTGVITKIYLYDRVYCFFTDPAKLHDVDSVRIVN